MYCGFKAKPTLCPQIKTASCQSCHHLYADRPLHLEHTQQESVRTDMVDSEQVLGCKAPMGLVLVLLLSSLLGPLGQVQAQDCEKPMRDTMSLTDEDIQKVHFPDGQSVTFECAMGYRTNGGSGQTTCMAGTWIPPTLTCTKYNCGSLELVNGQVDYSDGTFFGSVATFSCNDGYILGGRNQLTCGNTDWLGRTPTCSVVKCDSAPSVDNAEGPSPNREFYDYASVVRYKCLKDYTINGSASLKCSSNGKFTPNPPTCLMVRCKAPFIPNGSHKSGARPPYVHRSLVEYECNPGFKMEGVGVMTCQLNSAWSSTPECKVLPVDPTSSPVLPVDPTSSPDDSKTWSQSWWFIGLIIVILIIIISLTFWLIRKKRGSQPLRAPVPVEEDKIL
ncbi:unnamed protein product [Arctogadus glacialis]